MHPVLRDRGFRTHLIVYAAVNAGLMLINLLTAPKALWFQWPLIGWGLGILGHAFLVSQKQQPLAPGSAAAVSSTAIGSAAPSISAAKIEERAMQLWQASGAKAISEAAERARASEASGNAADAETWRRIEAVLLQMRGPRAS